MEPQLKYITAPVVGEPADKANEIICKIALNIPAAPPPYIWLFVYSIGNFEIKVITHTWKNTAATEINENIFKISEKHKLFESSLTEKDGVDYQNRSEV